MRREGGFILADTLIALTVVAIMLTSLFSSLRLLQFTSTSSAHQLEARLIAQALIIDHECPAREGHLHGEHVSFDWTCLETVEHLEVNKDMQVRSTILQLEWNGFNKRQSIELIKATIEKRSS